WLMEKVAQSMLAPAIVQSRVIPYGIDLDVFRPATKALARAALGLPQNVDIVLFIANGVRKNTFKDYETLRAAIARVAVASKQRLLLVAVGQDGCTERIGQAEVYFAAYEKDPVVVARYYQAADIYLHAARADTFPNVILEALACGIPVVATAVGGIPEQIKGLQNQDCNSSDLNRHGVDDATGVLAPAADAEAMANAIGCLLSN